METPTDAPVNARERAWADPVHRLKVEGMPAEAINLNVEGRQLTSPLQGFGQMWQKTYRLPLRGLQIAPAEVIRAWKDNFPKFWPEGNHFYAPLTAITPGEVAVLNLPALPGIRLSTGILVIYADDTSFTFMTPQGHMFAGWITFSALEEEGATVLQTQALIRANDPMYEAMFRAGILGGMEDRFWSATLENLARHLGVEGKTEIRAVLVDPRMQWREAKNIWHNAAIRSGLYTMAAPFRWLARPRRA